MKYLALLLAVATLALAEQSDPLSERLRPQPRQIFRDGIDENRNPLHPRRPSFKDTRQRLEQPSIGQLPLGPRPSYGESDYPQDEVEEETTVSDRAEESGSLFNLGAFSGSSVPHRPPTEEKSASDRSDEHYQVEEEIGDLPEYVEGEEEYNTDDHLETNRNFVDDEADYRQETRSPAHRYPDEEPEEAEFRTTTHGEQQLSSATASDQHVTQIPLVKNEFNPFALFGSDDRSRFRDDPPKEQNSGEQFHESSSKFEFAANPSSEKRPAQERTFETRPREQVQRHPSPNSFNQRPSSRHNRPQPHPQNPNLIPREVYNSPQRPSRPVSQHRPQPIYHDGGGRPHQGGHGGRPHQGGGGGGEGYSSLDYEDEETPDRLAELLQLSKFACVGQKDGYYADEDVNCEVFHFCQDGVKHSWLCPNNAAFHQVHLICMPHSEDNICERSSKFHFVNDFLYKEVGDHPENRSYVERYYPEGYEGGVANIPDYEGEVPPQAVKPPQYYRPSRGEAMPPPSYQSRPQGYSSARNDPRGRQNERPAPVNRREPGPPRNLRPIPQESVNEQSHRSQELSKPHFIEKSKPHFLDEKRKFELTRPKFEEERSPHHSEERRPSFESEQLLRQQQRHQQRPERPIIEDDFQPIPEEDLQHFERPSSFESQQHLPRQSSPSPKQEFVDRPSAHFQQHRPQPSPFAQGREHPQQGPRPQQLRPSGQPPVYHPKQQFYPRNQHGSSSNKMTQFRLPQEGRRPPRIEGTLNPLSFLG